MMISSKGTSAWLVAVIARAEKSAQKFGPELKIRRRNSAGAIMALLVVQALSAFASVPIAPQTVITTMNVGINPAGIAVNPVTGKIYVASFGSSAVAVIDPATNAASLVTVGTQPIAVAVNPLTNKIYIANSGSNNVTVIDGTNNS